MCQSVIVLSCIVIRPTLPSELAINLDGTSSNPLEPRPDSRSSNLRLKDLPRARLEPATQWVTSALLTTAGPHASLPGRACSPLPGHQSRLWKSVKLLLSAASPHWSGIYFLLLYYIWRFLCQNFIDLCQIFSSQHQFEVKQVIMALAEFISYSSKSFFSLFPSFLIGLSYNCQNCLKLKVFLKFVMISSTETNLKFFCSIQRGIRTNQEKTILMN